MGEEGKSEGEKMEGKKKNDGRRERRGDTRVRKAVRGEDQMCHLRVHKVV